MAPRITRREFSAGLAAAGVAAATRSMSIAADTPSDQVRLGIIGVGNRGEQLVSAFLKLPDARFTAVCDVYEPYIEHAKNKIGHDLFTTTDYRNLIARDDVDAVIIATPDHWHALQFIEACQAGKDVYVEKPLSLTIHEGRKMVEAARKHDRITQVGVHRRSVPMCLKAIEMIHDGYIGSISVCRSYRIRNEYPMGIGNPQDTKPPKGLDWNMWLGPAPEQPYNENRCLYKFRWFRHYSGGQLTNFGTHYLDMIQWALKQDAPSSVACMGGTYVVDDNRDIPDTLEALYEYPGGTLASFSTYDGNGAAGLPNGAELEIRGTLGTMYLTYGRILIEPSPVRTAPIPANDPMDRKGTVEATRKTEARIEPVEIKGSTSDVEHARDFIDGVKSRKPCRAPVEVGHRSTSATLLALIAFDRKRLLTWDPVAERVTNDDKANDLLHYEYRKPWKLPA